MPSSMQHLADIRTRHRDEPGVTALARHALAELARRKTGSKGLSELYLARLRDAVRAADPERRSALVAEMEAGGITRDQICDLYIPECARRLGDDWCDDRASFADVSIGAARLQSMLRDIALTGLERQDAPNSDLALLVTTGAHHTLGAMVLTGQLRRLGVSIRLMVGRPCDEVADAVVQGRFDGVLVSVAEADDLSAVTDTISVLRRLRPTRIPIIVGGGILGRGAEQARACTGADFATNEIVRAIEICESGMPGPHLP